MLCSHSLKNNAKTLLKNKELENKIFDDQYITDLLVSNGTCFGALSFDINNGEKILHMLMQ